MKIVGIICEYNPFHAGHRKQIDWIRGQFGGDCAIVCAMSGNFVQRGHPAIFDKSLRVKAAILCGADLVLELPVTCALSSAEGFAAGGVRVLAPFCDYLCFGTETGNGSALMDTARALLSDAFPLLLRDELSTGKSFPAARAAALNRMGLDAEILSRPNDILAVEYCKAMIAQDTNMQPLPIVRAGSYHAETPDPENPSATAVRALMVNGQDWKPYVPEEASAVFENAPIHCICAGERAMVMKLRSMEDEDFAALPFGSEGLWQKFMHACRSRATLEEILTATKSKRYTRSRIDRMAMCAFLGITKALMEEPAPYTRILAFNDKGRGILNTLKETAFLVNAGVPIDHPVGDLEKRCGDLYGLFCRDGMEPPGAHERSRVYYHKEQI